MRDEQKIQVREHAIHPPTTLRVSRIRNHRLPRLGHLERPGRYVANRGRADQFFQPWVPVGKGTRVREVKETVHGERRDETMDAFGPKASVPNFGGE